MEMIKNELLKNEVLKNGVEVYPVSYSIFIGGLTFVFSVLAVFNLWESNFKLVVIFLFFSLINLATEFGFALYNSYTFPSPLIIFLNFAKLGWVITYWNCVI